MLDLPEGLNEVAAICKAALHPDLARLEPGGTEQLGGLFHPELLDILNGRDAQHLTEAAQAGALAQGHAGRDAFHGQLLLILDDLGTEFVTPYFITTFYSLLNNRLGAGLPTIVTTNITDGALLEKLYTEKISSRLSSFVPFLFMGDDIRAQKAEEA